MGDCMKPISQCWHNLCLLLVYTELHSDLAGLLRRKKNAVHELGSKSKPSPLSVNENYVLILRRMSNKIEYAICSLSAQLSASMTNWFLKINHVDETYLTALSRVPTLVQSSKRLNLCRATALTLFLLMPNPENAQPHTFSFFPIPHSHLQILVPNPKAQFTGWIDLSFIYCIRIRPIHPALMNCTAR